MEIKPSSYWVQSGTYSLLLNLTNSAFGFGIFYILIRVFTKSEFGVWAIYLTITTMIEAVRSGLIRNALIKFLASNKESLQAQIFSSSLILNTIVSILVIISLLLFATPLGSIWDSDFLPDMLLLFCLYLFVTIPFSQIEFTLQAAGKFKEIFFIYFFRNTVLFITVVLFYLEVVEPLMFTLILFQIIAVFFGTAIGVLFFYKLKGRYFSSKFGYVKRLFHFGKYVVGTNLSGILNTRIDQFMIGSIVSTASVAVYNASSRITTFMNMPAAVLASIVFPKSAKLQIEKDKKSARDLYEKSLSANLAIIIPAILLVLLFAEEIIVIIAGSEYLDMTNVLRLMVILSGFVPFARLFGTIMDSLGYQSLNFYMTSISAISNIVLNYFLITQHGIMGALFGTLVVFILSFFVMQIYLRKILSVNLITVFKLIPFFYQKLWEFVLGIFKYK